MKARIEVGRALVLVGPQGCGKTRLARELASAAGSYSELNASQLESDAIFSSVLKGEPVSVIVDGVPKSAQVLQRLKVLISNQTQLKSPNFIFCTNDAASLTAFAERRFNVVHLN